MGFDVTGRLTVNAVSLNEEILKKEIGGEDFAIAVVTATKPDFYKQASLVTAAEKKGLPCFVLNTGQHFDALLSHGLKEFDLEDKIACDLNVRGDLLQKTGELVLKTGWFGRYLKKHYSETTVIPVVHGDTLVAGVLPIGWMFGRNEKVAQNEAGLRGMAPEFFQGMDTGKVPDDFFTRQFESKWKIIRNEPFPEQWDTFVGGAGSEFHFAPVELNKKHLIREGYPDENIFVVGNSVVDAIKLKRGEKPEKSIFEIYPGLEKHDDWLRVDIHRRGNLTPRRFKAIVGGVIDLVVNSGRNVLFIEMTATKRALEHYNLRKKLLELAEKENFLFTPLWPEYSHVVEFFDSGNCFAALTDSGSMQEELNEIEKTICLTCRLNTDRPETVFQAHTNVLIPPVSREWISPLVNEVYDDADLAKTLSKPNRLYGENVGEKIVDAFIKIRDENANTFSWAHGSLGLWQERPGVDYL
jgi:UDP-N-acetylglucosamine 2-epimerase